MSKEYKYAKDATRGRCPMINPFNYKPDTQVQVWLDARKLVMLDNWLEDNGIRIRHMSEIIKETIDVVIEQLLSNELVEKVEYSKIARDSLMYKFKKKTLNPGNRCMRNVAHNLHLDERRKEKHIGTTGHEHRPSAKISQEEYDRVMDSIQAEKESEARKTISRANPNSEPAINPEYLSTATEQGSLSTLKNQPESQSKLNDDSDSDNDVTIRHEWRSKSPTELDAQEARIKSKDAAMNAAFNEMLKGRGK